MFGVNGSIFQCLSIFHALRSLLTCYIQHMLSMSHRTDNSMMCARCVGCQSLSNELKFKFITRVAWLLRIPWRMQNLEGHPGFALLSPRPPFITHMPIFMPRFCLVMIFHLFRVGDCSRARVVLYLLKNNHGSLLCLDWLHDFWGRREAYFSKY